MTPENKINALLFLVMTFFQKQKYNTPVEAIILCFAIAFFSANCNRPENRQQEQQKSEKELGDFLYLTRSEDSLQLMLKQFIDEKNDFAAMLCYKRLGLFFRENSRFTEAIHNHREGLTLALKLKDTIEITQAHNNLGTDFRRIGAQEKASEHHYKALEYAEVYSQANVPGHGMKNRVVALNGIGNINLSLGYLDEAEKYFRAALEDEIKLNSFVGQAINYANLGAIFEKRQQWDSAYIYYSRSLEQNRMAESDMGIGLCLIYIGQLHEKKNNYQQAKIEYERAYNLMNKISDKWHWLEACISIARINLLENNISEFDHYIRLAEKTANQIESPEHLAGIYLLKHEYDTKRADYRQALLHYKLFSKMQDSVYGIQKTNRLMDVRVNYEQNKIAVRLESIEAENRARQEEKQLILYISWVALLVGLIMTALLFYAYRQRSRSNEILKQLDAVRSNFYTNITHEFKTPLAVIQGFNNILQEKTNLSEKEKTTYRNAINRQCDNLLNLVNQLLDISKLKSGKDNPKWKRGNIIAYLRMTAESFNLFAQKNGVDLVFYSDLVSQEMDFIPFYIDKIVSNIISNAIKHTEIGDRINFIVMKGKRPDTITIRISDTGEGICKEDLKRIFELFYQGKNAQNTSGTGIGLSFTQMMVKKMKGEITVESELGKGTAFTITLPVKNKYLENIEPLKEQIETSPLAAKQLSNSFVEEMPETEKSDEKENSSNPIVLVVEDNKDISMYIKSLLSEKYKVILAKNGQEGLETAEIHIPDLVITDVMMPVKSGTQFCREMKQHIMLNHIPVIMLTAKSNDEDRIEGLQCGADAFIKKPFHPEELLARIHNMLDGQKKLIEKYKKTLENNISSINKTNNDANLKYLQTITDIIHTEIQNPALSSAFIAERMAVSMSQLNRKLNAITGQSTISYILKIKLGKAKKMLQDTSVSINEVADACGFYDANYFTRVFKKEFGIAPSQYRKIPK